MTILKRTLLEHFADPSGEFEAFESAMRVNDRIYVNDVLYGRIVGRQDPDSKLGTNLLTPMTASQYHHDQPLVTNLLENVKLGREQLVRHVSPGTTLKMRKFRWHQHYHELILSNGGTYLAERLLGQLRDIHTFSDDDYYVDGRLLYLKGEPVALLGDRQLETVFQTKGSYVNFNPVESFKRAVFDCRKTALAWLQSIDLSKVEPKDAEQFVRMQHQSQQFEKLLATTTNHIRNVYYAQSARPEELFRQTLAFDAALIQQDIHEDVHVIAGWTVQLADSDFMKTYDEKLAGLRDFLARPIQDVFSDQVNVNPRGALSTGITSLDEPYGHVYETPDGTFLLTPDGIETLNPPPGAVPSAYLAMRLYFAHVDWRQRAAGHLLEYDRNPHNPYIQTQLVRDLELFEPWRKATTP